MNILFIFSDQQHRYALGCMDNSDVDTPCLDRLAKKGMLFRRCYSNDPVCGLFRGSLMTGQYTSRCGVVQNGHPLPEGTTTFADALNAGGYDTKDMTEPLPAEWLEDKKLDIHKDKVLGTRKLYELPSNPALDGTLGKKPNKK